MDDFIETEPQSSKWVFDRAGSIAYSLIVYIRNARFDLADSMIGLGPFKKIDWKKTSHWRLAWHRRGAFGPHSKLAKQELTADFSDDTFYEWWSFAERVILDSYPEPHEDPDLTQLVPTMITVKNQTKPNPKINTDNGLRAEIFRKIKARFKSFARNACFDEVV